MRHQRHIYDDLVDGHDQSRRITLAAGVMLLATLLLVAIFFWLSVV